MQLDSIRIAIRERELLDVYDLALKVLRVYFLPLVLAGLVGCAPVALLNAWLLEDEADRIDIDMDLPWDYVGGLIMLLVWEMPIATAPITLLLGQVLFQEKPDPRRMVADFLQSLPQLLVFQVVLRGLLVPLIVTWIFPLFIWPYLNEIILLERNPLVRRKSQGMSTFRRSRALHSGSAGDFFARFMAGTVAAIAFVIAVWLLLWFVRISLWSNQSFDRTMYTIYLPVAIWTAASFFAIVRFLSYLDLRIRREGWEIELRLRAEAEKLARHAV